MDNSIVYNSLPCLMCYDEYWIILSYRIGITDNVVHDKQDEKNFLPDEKNVRLLSEERCKKYDRQIKRQTTLRDYCAKTRNISRNLTAINKKFFILSDASNLIYCGIPKVACTNWMRLIKVFEGEFQDPLEIGTKQQVHKLYFKKCDELNQTEFEWRRNIYYSFIIVRHPLERLLSGFRNKLQDPYNTDYQKTLGSDILRLYREGLTEAEYKAGKNVTFAEFANFVVEKFFDKGLMDLHWQRMSTLCNPCGMKYNFIAKMETLVEDSKEILRQIGWGEKVKFPVNATDKYKNSIKDIMKEYYGSLSRTTLDKLYEIYREDFLVFDYPMYEY